MFGYLDIFQSSTGAVLSTILTCFLTYYMYNYGWYWWRKNVPGPYPLPLIGNFFPRWMGTMSIADYDHRFYSDFGGKRYCGFFEFRQKTIMIGDLPILKHILIKDFDNFVNRSNVSLADPIVEKMVLVLQDDMWRKVRSLLTSAFSSGKIKAMLPLMLQTSDNFFQQLFIKDETTVENEFCEMLRRYATDTVATIAFGIEVNELKDKKGEFTQNAGKIFPSVSRGRRFMYLFMDIFPFLVPLTNFKLRDESAPLFFKKIIGDTLKFRSEHSIERYDFLHMLNEAQKAEEGNESKKVLSEDVFLAQCITFFAAGIDTVSTTLSLLLHNLAYFPDIQNKVIDEIDSVLEKSAGKITYEAISEMKYLDMVLKETERMYPSAPRTYRVCKNTYTLPGTNVTLEPNTTIVIPIRCIHYDPEHYHDPEVFDPERFSPDRKLDQDSLAFLTFGQGPRNCIGMRFASMEMKVCIVNLLSQARIYPGSKSKNPLTFNKLSGVLRVSGGIWLKTVKRQGERKEINNFI